MSADDTIYQINYSDQADKQAWEELSAHLRAYNDSRSEHHRAIRAEGGKPLELYIRDGSGALLGGLIAETYWGWLYIDRLLLREALRGQGYGRRLMQQAEQIARERGCMRAYLTTFSFQARDFYQKLGYRVVGQLDDYPPGMAYYWMRKDFPVSQGTEQTSA
jgi:GNAT superfamily N-acetyltransferase